MSDPFIHPTALVDSSVRIGKGTKVWAFAQLAEGVVVGENCMIGNGVYIDRNVQIGNRVNIHNKALLYRNLIIEDDVFVGPAVCFVNDPYPKAGRIRNMDELVRVVKHGASIGANTTVMADVCIGSRAVVGAGSLVTQDVQDGAFVYGSPAKLRQPSAQARKMLDA